MRRPNRKYMKSGRLIKIEPQTAKRCRIINSETKMPYVVIVNGVHTSIFASRVQARKVLSKLVRQLPPRQSKDEPLRYYLENL
jgi:hypothetical protein